MNDALFPDHDKRYKTFDRYVRQRFSCKCAKIGLDGGFTCPNRDGTKGYGGCIFCSGAGVGAGPDGSLPLARQYELGRKRLEGKWGRLPAIASFQARTSTYAPAPILRKTYEEALGFEDVVGLTISTRPDALSPEILDLLEELAQKTKLTVELGLQTMHDDTLKRIRRGHTRAQFEDAFFALRRRGIDLCVHLLNGLPGESAAQMRQSGEYVARLAPELVKFHCLYIAKGSALEQIYRENPFPLLSREAYVGIVADQIERLPESTAVERICADPAKDELIAPQWIADKKKTLALLDKTLAQRGTRQGVWYNCTKDPECF